MLQKEPERTTIQSTAEEHKRQEYMSKHSSVTARKQHFQSNLSLKFQRKPFTKSSISDHFWPPFGPLDPFWEGSGSQRETERILDTILLDFWWIWGALGYPFGSLLAEKPLRMTSRALFLRFWKSSSKNTEICMISDSLQPSRLSSRAREGSIFTIYP